MNIFYCPPSQINGKIAEFDKDETRHITRVLRHREGDNIRFVDGRGGRYEGKISRILHNAVQAEVTERKLIPPANPRLVLGLGIIRKRDRLEFAVEKATELGADEICLFRSEHTVKENVRMDRLEMTALSAMKQCLRAWLPEVRLFKTFEDLLDGYEDAACIAAHEKSDVGKPANLPAEGDILLLVGPEGGFSDSEIEEVQKRGGQIISLGDYRLRTETAALVLLSRFQQQTH